MRFAFWSVSLLVLGLFVALCFPGCGGGFQGYTPPPCSTALSCVLAPNLYQNAALCQFGNNLMYRSGNQHPSLEVLATFEVDVVDSNNPAVPTTTNFQSFPLAPNGQANLGCQYELGTGGDYEYFYRAVSACFMGTNLDCTVQSAIPKRPPIADCLQAPDYCIKFDLSGLPSGPDLKTARQAAGYILDLINKKPPITFNIGNLLLPGGSCQRNDAIISAANQFEDVGLECSASILVQNKTAKALKITAPTILSGDFVQVPGTSASISPRDTKNFPVLEWFDQSDKSMGTEHVARIDFVTTSTGNPQVRILGDAHFCISITFPKP